MTKQSLQAATAPTAFLPPRAPPLFFRASSGLRKVYLGNVGQPAIQFPVDFVRGHILSEGSGKSLLAADFLAADKGIHRNSDGTVDVLCGAEIREAHLAERFGYAHDCFEVTDLAWHGLLDVGSWVETLRKTYRDWICSGC
jgi:hypothetical protein